MAPGQRGPHDSGAAVGRRPPVPARSRRAGSCRIGSDPRTSVSQPWGRVWVTKLSRRDGALHVTNGSINPVLTMLALAWRNSERLAAELTP